MYTYRLENLPLYIPFGHAALYARTFSFAKHAVVQKNRTSITKLFAFIVIGLATVYFIFLNDVFGLLMTVGVFILLLKRPKDRVFFLTMYIIVAVLEIGGTAYSTWAWPSTAFNKFQYLPSNNPPSGISLFYFLLDIGCFVCYKLFNPNVWKRYKSVYSTT